MEFKLLPLIEPIGARYQSLTVDSRLVNAFAEKGQGEGEAFVYKRPAFKLYQTLDAGGATGRGVAYWNTDLYAVLNGTVYKDGVALVGAVANSGMYSFTSCLGATPVLFMQNGTNAYTIDGAGTITAVIDPDYPAATVGGAVYLDGTVYVMNTASAVLGSDAAANNPASWDPLNKILAQSEPTASVYLAKQLVYVLALKQNYTEAFYDAGNPTGSVLSPVQGAKMNFGCVSGGTVKDVGGDLIWVANSGEGYYSVVMVSGLKLEVISTPPIERLLSAAAYGSTFYSWSARVEGHRFYGVTNVGLNITLVYDLTSRLWYQWTAYGDGYLPYVSSCQGTGAITIFQHATNGKLYTLDTATYKDAPDGNNVFPVWIYTPNYDGGTRRTKTLQWACLVGDQVTANVTVYTSDDDYTTWSSGLAVSMGLNQPVVSTLGAFSKRAFKFLHQADTAFRLKAFEMYLDVGINS